MKKTCRRCHIERDIAYFKKNKSLKGGRENVCNPCENIRRSKRMQKYASEDPLKYEKYVDKLYDNIKYYLDYEITDPIESWDYVDTV